MPLQGLFISFLSSIITVRSWIISHIHCRIQTPLHQSASPGLPKRSPCINNRAAHRHAGGPERSRPWFTGGTKRYKSQQPFAHEKRAEAPSWGEATRITCCCRSSTRPSPRLTARSSGHGTGGAKGLRSYSRTAPGKPARHRHPSRKLELFFPRTAPFPGI